MFESNNDLDKAEKILKFLYENHRDYKSLSLLGILEYKKGNFYGAISNFLEVYENDNQNKECILYLGKTKLALKDYENALIDFKKYKEFESNEEIEQLIKNCQENLHTNSRNQSY